MLRIIQPSEFIREYVDTPDNAVPFLRAGNTTDGEIDFNDFVFVHRDKLKGAKDSFIQENDILITRTGAKAGSTARVPALDREYCISSHSLRMIPDKTKVEPKYLEAFLLSRWGKAQLERSMTGAAQRQLQIAGISPLLIPIPPRNIQTRLVSAMVSARASYRAKLAEADALLGGLDSFLLDALGLIQPPKDERKVFAMQCSGASTRFDPHFHLPAFAQIAKLLDSNKSKQLGRVANFSKETWKPQGLEKTSFKYIEINNVNTSTGEACYEEIPVVEAPSRARMTVQTGDIIVSLTRPHHGAIAQIIPELDGCVASTGFSVIREVDESQITKDYLWCILRSKMSLAQMLQRASGGNYPAITEPELAKVLIPIPDMKTQIYIAAEAQRRRGEARRLCAEAETEWQAAIKWFEEQLIGPAQS